MLKEIQMLLLIQGNKQVKTQKIQSYIIAVKLRQVQQFHSQVLLNEQHCLLNQQLTGRYR
tara:strand:+ start:266 stop:445 length:180 start_codon:yes stop_codon:yes gene_type:complete